MIEIVTVLSLLLFGYIFLTALRIRGISEGILVFFCVSTAHIIGIGFLLSWIDRLSDIRVWALLSLLATGGLFGILFKRNQTHYSDYLRLVFASLADWRWYFYSLSGYEKLLLIPLLFSVFLLGGINLIEILWVVPHNSDSMTYHLARMAYYLQHNNLSYFEANYWAQVIHPKNSSILFLYTYLTSGRNENLTQIVQFISYWVAACSVYAISRRIGLNKVQGIFAAAAACLLTEWLMQATTTQNDMLLTAYIGCICAFLFLFRETKEKTYLALAALGISLAIGVKASSFLSLIPVTLIAVYLILGTYPAWMPRIIHAAFLGSCTILAVCVFALPSGFLENYQIFGHPIGPAKVRQLHTFEGEPFLFTATNGTRNLLRYGVDFLSLDGFPPVPFSQTCQNALRAIPEKLIRLSGIDIETPEASRGAFQFIKPPVAHEDFSYWGILGFGLVWIVVLLALLGLIKSPDIKILSLAAVLFCIAQAYSGPYDPWKGRYFTTCAVFAVPAIGAAITHKNRLLRTYLVFIVLIGCGSAMSAVLFRKNSAVLSLPETQTTTIFSSDRMRQLTSNRPPMVAPLKAFEQLVPQNAKVAVFLNLNSYEYPLFGEHLSRTIFPINSFMQGLQPIPPAAEYLLYVNSNFPCALPDDIDLGEALYLRKLTPANRGCPH